MQLKTVFEPGDLQDGAAVFVQPSQLDLAEHVLASPFHGEKCLQTLAIDERAFAHVHNKIDDLFSSLFSPTAVEAAIALSPVKSPSTSITQTLSYSSTLTPIEM